MAGKGAPPGTRYGGRTKGTPNKVNLARAQAIAEIAQRTGKPIGIEAMEDGMHRYIALAAPYQKGGPQENIAQFMEYFDKAMALAKDVAPYQSPRLQSTVLQGDKDKPLSATLNIHFV